jgi:hypothetical protein
MGKKPKEKVITITADGSEAYGLYDDNLPWRNLGGKIEAVRASEVRMNDEGRWEIFIFDEDRVLPETFLNRSDAIDHEIAYLNDYVAPESLRKLFDNKGGADG